MKYECAHMMNGRQPKQKSHLPLDLSSRHLRMEDICIKGGVIKLENKIAIEKLTVM